MITLGFVSSLRRAITAATMLTLLSAACYGQERVSGNWSAALNSPEIMVKSESIEKSAPRSILLLGENHASVKTQQQLAELLEALFRAHEVDAILVEGSSGPIDAASLSKRLNSMKAGNIGEFWKGQLDLGHIAGYEYVALTRNDVTVFGIEDMNAKNEYAIGAAPRQVLSGLQGVVEKNRRAIALAREVSAGLDPKALRSAGVDAELSSYQNKIDDLIAFTNSSGSKFAQAVEAEERLNALYRKMAPARKIIAAKGAAPKTNAEYEAAFTKAGYTTMADVMADIKRMKEVQTWLEANQDDVKKMDDRLNALESELEDQYFIMVNVIRSAAGGTPTPALQTFMRDESERQRIQSEQQNPETPYLEDRDRYMVRNTMAFLANHSAIKKIVLIVGYAHLEDLTKLLRREEVNLLSGRIAASTEDIEGWEGRAWHARSIPTERVFSSGSNKEISRLLDNVFRQEVPVLVADLQAAGKSGINFGNSHVFEMNPGARNGKSIVFTADPSSLLANWGSMWLGLASCRTR